MPPTPSPIGAAIGARLAWAAGLVLTAARPGRPSTDPVVAWSARALVLRHLVEAAVLADRAPAQPPAWTVWVDALHGASMVVVAGISPSLRRPALISAGAAAVISGTSALARRRAAV